MSSGPHHTNIGKRECKQMPTAIRKLCGQLSTGPSPVLAQSKSRTRAAISPPAAFTSDIIIPAMASAWGQSSERAALASWTEPRVLDTKDVRNGVPLHVPARHGSPVYWQAVPPRLRFIDWMPAGCSSSGQQPPFEGELGPEIHPDL